ncbi:MAG: dTMP kinase [Candidatus Aminicenantia bacterium]
MNNSISRTLKEKPVNKKLSKGILIVLEGIDGSGKTTQAKLLFQKLIAQGFEVVIFKEPSSGKWGKKIKEISVLENSINPEQELKLFLKDRKDNIKKNLKPSLDKNKVVILDRYYFSTIAYQGARGIDIELIKRLNEKMVIEPDLVFILDIKPEVGLNRIENRKKKEKLFEKEDFLCKVREIFNSLVDEKIIRIDATQPLEEISERIETTVLNYLKSYLI